eukprot:Tamp_10513.p1 GENE.Tamp_10513~~Tamp_10513.p1  ORF type:complete len:579 (+),score=116.03 Tamp_10513:46-1782(+)
MRRRARALVPLAAVGVACCPMRAAGTVLTDTPRLRVSLARGPVAQLERECLGREGTAFAALSNLPGAGGAGRDDIVLAGVGDALVHLAAGPHSSLKLVPPDAVAALAAPWPPASIEASARGGVLKLGPLGRGESGTESLQGDVLMIEAKTAARQPAPCAQSRGADACRPSRDAGAARARDAAPDHDDGLQDAALLLLSANSVYRLYSMVLRPGESTQPLALATSGVAIFLSQGHLRARPLPQTLPPTRHSPAASQGGEYAQDRREDGGGDRLADDADDSLEDEGCVPKKARLLSSSESRRHSALLLNDDGDGTDGDGARKGVQEDGCVVKACRDMLAAAQPGAKEGAAEKEAVRLLREAMLTDLRPAHDGGPSAELDQERQHARREAETLRELQDVQARLLASAQTPHSGAAHEQEQLEARMYELLRLLDPADTMLPREYRRGQGEQKRRGREELERDLFLEIERLNGSVTGPPCAYHRQDPESLEEQEEQEEQEGKVPAAPQGSSDACVDTTPGQHERGVVPAFVTPQHASAHGEHGPFQDGPVSRGEVRWFQGGRARRMVVNTGKSVVNALLFLLV